jgi:hypothetical protein
MRKILLVLLMASSAFATQVSTTKITGTTWGANDTGITSNNFSWDSLNVTMGAFWRRPIANSYTLDTVGLDSVNLSNAGDVWKDSTTGAAKWPKAIKTLANNAAIKIAAASGTISSGLTNLYINGTGSTLLDNKGITINSLTINSGAQLTRTGTGVIYLRSTGTPLVFANGGTFTNSGTFIMLQRSTNGDMYSIAGSPTINGTGQIYCYYASGAPTGPLTLNLPAITIGGTVEFGIQSALAGNTYVFNNTGSMDITGGLSVYSTGVSSNVTLNVSTYNLKAAALTMGAYSQGSAILAVNLGSGTHAVTSFVPAAAVTYTTGSTTINFQTCQLSVLNALTFAANYTITGTVGQTITYTGTGTTTSNGKSHPGNVVINSSGLTRTLADSMDVAGDFTIQAGALAQATKPFAVHGDYYLLSTTDSSNVNGMKYLYKSWTRGAGSKAKNDSAITKLVSDNLCNLTTNTARLNYVHIKALSYGIQKVKQLDNAVIVRLRDTIGAWNQNGFTRSDSIAVWLDSGHIWNAARTCWKYSLYGPNFKATTLTDTLTYAGSAACSLVVSCVNTIGNVKVNLSGAGSLKQVGATHYGALNVADGVLSPTDTIYATSLNWTSTDTSTLGVVIVSGSAYIASTAKLGATKIIMLSQCSIGGGNANLPPVTYPAGCGATKRRNGGWLGLGVNNGLMF